MFSRAFFTVSFVAALALVANGFQILAPSDQIWWVSGGVNVLTWDCHAPDIDPSYEVFANNTNTNILVTMTAIIAQLENDQCSHSMQPADIAGLPVADNYQIIFYNTNNLAQAVATSQLFSVKAPGSQYSTVTATPGGFSQATTTASAPAGTGSTSKSGASSLYNVFADQSGMSQILRAGALIGGVALGMGVLA